MKRFKDREVNDILITFRISLSMKNEIDNVIKEKCNNLSELLRKFVKELIDKEKSEKI